MNRHRGFLLVIAVLVTAVVLSVGVALSSVVRREIILASTSRESQRALYAADTGFECALFWDIRCTRERSTKCGYTDTAYATSSFSAPELSEADRGFRCNGVDITSSLANWSVTKDIAKATTHFEYSLKQGAEANDVAPFVKVNVTKTFNDTNGNSTYDFGEGRTKIDARGYNNNNANDKRRVERGVQVTYEE